uniref:Cytochrome b6-f complex subunit 6 n=1 Tax=Acrostichum speciosum TaxID=366450 RepID=A0A7M1VKU4_9MONI|nr:PetL [Acrostichum speciosum]QOS04093.1 PetL [Acrostichum speciosum]
MLTLLSYFVFLILALTLTLVLFIGLNKIQIL